MHTQTPPSWAELLTGREAEPAPASGPALVIRGYLIEPASADELLLVNALGELVWRRCGPLARRQREQEQRRQRQE